MPHECSQEYDAIPPTRLQVAVEWLISSAVTLACLGAPLLLPAAARYNVALAWLWMLGSMWAISCGCTSLAAALAATHATHGAYAALAPTWRLAAAVAAEALLVLLPGGALLTLACRLAGEERQTGGEWLLRLTPLREVVRPTHFSPLPPSAAARRYAAAGGAVDARLFADDDEE